jgi:hypothetical protein
LIDGAALDASTYSSLMSKSTAWVSIRHRAEHRGPLDAAAAAARHHIM